MLLALPGWYFYLRAINVIRLEKDQEAFIRTEGNMVFLKFFGATEFHD